MNFIASPITDKFVVWVIFHAVSDNRATRATRYSHNREGQGGELSRCECGEGCDICGIDEQFYATELMFCHVGNQRVNIGVRKGRARRADIVLMSSGESRTVRGVRDRAAVCIQKFLDCKGRTITQPVHKGIVCFTKQRGGEFLTQARNIRGFHVKSLLREIGGSSAGDEVRSPPGGDGELAKWEIDLYAVRILLGTSHAEFVNFFHLHIFGGSPHAADVGAGFCNQAHLVGNLPIQPFKMRLNSAGDCIKAEL